MLITLLIIKVEEFPSLEELGNTIPDNASFPTSFELSGFPPVTETPPPGYMSEEGDTQDQGDVMGMIVNLRFNVLSAVQEGHDSCINNIFFLELNRNVFNLFTSHIYFYDSHNIVYFIWNIIHTGCLFRLILVVLIKIG